MTPAPAPIRRQEAPVLALVDCPLCDTPAEFDADAAALDCAVCTVRLEVAPDAPFALPAAA